MRTLTLLLMSTVLAASCNGVDFAGAPDKQPSAKRPDTDFESGRLTFEIPCEQPTSQREVTTGSDVETMADVKGSFCPKASGDLTVLFIIDMSGSMGKYIPQGKRHIHPGNDPLTGGTCGRLRAAQAVVEKVKKQLDYGEVIKAGLLPFAGRTLRDRVIAPVEIEIFAEELTPQTFCMHLNQNHDFGYHPHNPGAISGGGVDSSTNYRDAFEYASSLMGHDSGRKVVYFISDGLPTSGGRDPVATGIRAGQELRSRLPRLVVNSVLLGNTGRQAREVLTRIAGTPDRVRVATEASDLANEILKLPEILVDRTSLSATLSVGNRAERDLNMQRVEQTSEGLSFELEPFKLEGPTPEGLPHRISVQARTNSGTPLELSLVIKNISSDH